VVGREEEVWRPKLLDFATIHRICIKSKVLGRISSELISNQDLSQRTKPAIQSRLKEGLDRPVAIFSAGFYILLLWTSIRLSQISINLGIQVHHKYIFTRSVRGKRLRAQREVVGKRSHTESSSLQRS